MNTSQLTMIPFVCIMLAAIQTISSIDVERLQTFPVPMNNADLDRFGGNWYTQGRYVQCSWDGSKTFTDYVYNIQPKDDSYDSYTVTSTWRQEDICTCINSVTSSKSPGIFRQKDPIGNVYSGEWYLVDTDYKTYSVIYGCTKPSVTGDTCSDPYICTDTRHPRPNRYTLAKINHILKQRFGLTLRDLVIVSHKKPCVKSPSKPYMDYSYLQKKY